MRCPFCFAEIGERPPVCPSCHETLMNADGTFQSMEDVWGSSEDYHVWILLGNLVTIAGGGLLFYLGIRGLGGWSIALGLFLLALAVLSLLVARGGARWENLTRGQQVVVWAGVLGFVGLVGVFIFWLLLTEDTPDPYRPRYREPLRRSVWDNVGKRKPVDNPPDAPQDKLPEYQE